MELYEQVWSCGEQGRSIVDQLLDFNRATPRTRDACHRVPLTRRLESGRLSSDVPRANGEWPKK